MGKNKRTKTPLTTKEREQVRNKFGKPGCSFAKDGQGVYCYTHRARSKSYPSVSKIPKRIVKFIESTG